MSLVEHGVAWIGGAEADEEVHGATVDYEPAGCKCSEMAQNGRPAPFWSTSCVF
jgi:hypothetical protein